MADMNGWHDARRWITGSPGCLDRRRWIDGAWPPGHFIEIFSFSIFVLLFCLLFFYSSFGSFLLFLLFFLFFLFFRGPEGLDNPFEYIFLNIIHIFFMA